MFSYSRDYYFRLLFKTLNNWAAKNGPYVAMNVRRQRCAANQDHPESINIHRITFNTNDLLNVARLTSLCLPIAFEQDSKICCRLCK